MHGRYGHNSDRQWRLQRGMFSPTALSVLMQSSHVLDPVHGPATCRMILAALDAWERTNPDVLGADDRNDLAIVRTALELRAASARAGHLNGRATSSHMPRRAISKVFGWRATTGR